ncbi:integrator complex subunit 3 isoform X2 [Neocloeon triangulifer]|uniref:integrator complex subunit 3 isoform X2 n=1 Tax=Neocloeon triangulifer TaxID=2078957 RepID=UPI00286F56E9|nr:integrator complex subunit 3 isoform X2 [Neocloeon triangulifer]
MEAVNPSSSRLFVSCAVDAKDDLEERFDRCFQLLQKLTSGLSEKESNDVLNSTISKDPRCHDEICIGLMVAVLLDPQSAAKSYRDLTLIARDGMNTVVQNLTQIAVERFSKLSEVVWHQLLWFTRELIRNSVNGVDILCWNVLRNISGGDVSPRNLAVAEYMLDVFMEYRAWLDKNSFLVASVVYTYLRLIDDHGGNHTQALAPLRQKEVTFTVSLLREKFNDCLVIGRDLVRLLQNVARIPEFESLWKDVYHNPKVLSPNFTGVQQLMQTRTSRRFLQSRLTPDMEKKIVFLTSNVRFGNHKRYQDWFQRQYLNTPESQSLRCDLIRFIVGVIHPTNELLCSDIIPRWAVIGWLLTTCTSTVAAANAKLALFYDWLFFEPEKDNIMNIEPAILVMFHSMRSHPAVTATLLDFLVKIIPNFYPALSEKVQAGIFASLKTILDKRVLPNLNPIFDNPKLDRELRVSVREKFKEFCAPIGADGNVKHEDFPHPSHPVLMDCSPVPISPSNNHDEPAFSDEDEEDVPLATKVKLKKSEDKKDNIEDAMAALEDDMRTELENLKSNDNETQCEAMERLVQLIIDDNADEETAPLLATCLCSVLRDQFENKLLPSDPLDENIEESIEKPLFVMFRNFAQMQDGNQNPRPLVQVLVEMSEKEPKVGYFLLYFLKASNLDGLKTVSSVSVLYEQYCKAMEKDLVNILLADMKLCQEDDRTLFVWLVPEVYQLFPSATQNNTELLHLLLEVVDANQMQLLICLVLQSKLVIFNTDTLVNVLKESLNWETFEQCCFWHLIEAHNIPVDDLMPILPELDFLKHAEALSSVMLFLKQERPSVDLLKNILIRTAKSTDFFVVSIMQYWIQDYEDKVADMVAGLLNKLSSSSPNKRKRGAGNKGPGPPSMEQILAHLDQLRIVSKHNPKFFLLDSMQRALQQVLATCTETQKKKFTDLLALAEELSPRGSGTGGRGTRKAASTAKSQSRTRPIPIPSESSEDSSEEEEIIKPKQAKKRKKATVVESD